MLGLGRGPESVGVIGLKRSNSRSSSNSNKRKNLLANDRSKTLAAVRRLRADEINVRGIVESIRRTEKLKQKERALN